MCEVSKIFIEKVYDEAYPLLLQKESYILEEITKEIKKFEATLSTGMKEFDKCIVGIERKNQFMSQKDSSYVPETVISGKQAFRLYDTYGFPLELTSELAAEKGMTVDAEGVKVYYNLDHATIANASLSLSWHALPWLSLTSSLSHAVGRDDEGDNLPLIAPLAYRAAADFSLKGVKVQVEAKGNARQRHFAPKYGEKETSAYTIYNISSQYSFDINKTGLTLRAGIENVFDRSYSTYADWCGIPQKGRNTYVNLSVSL